MAHLFLDADGTVSQCVRVDGLFDAATLIDLSTFFYNGGGKAHDAIDTTCIDVTGRELEA